MARRKKGTDPEKDKFLPKEGETYKDYMRRLSNNKGAAPYGVAGMIATSMLIKSGGGNRPVEPEKLKALTEKISAQPSFNNLLKRNDVKLLVANGAGSELCVKLAEEEEEYQKACEPYARSKDYDDRKADFEFTTEYQKQLGQLIASGGARKGPEEKQEDYEARVNQEYAKTTWVLSHTQKPSKKDPEQGSPTAEECRSLVWEARKRINGPEDVPGGANLSEEEFTLNMCLLNRYMPRKEFADYCKAINKNRTREQGQINPEDFDMSRLLRRKERAADFNRRSAQRLDEQWKQNHKVDAEALAELLAVRQLSHANGNNVLQGWQVEAEKKKLLAKGTAFQRMMQDIEKKPEQQEKLMEKLKEGADVEELAIEARTQMRDHALRSAQYRVNRSIRALADGPSNTFLDTEHLADILAAREFAAKFRTGTEPLSNGGFYERSLQIQNDPAFQRIAERYKNDPKYREELKNSLKNDETAGKLERDYMEIQLDLRERQAEREEKQREQEQREREQREQEQPAAEQERQREDQQRQQQRDQNQPNLDQQRELQREPQVEQAQPQLGL